jgi:NAD(P)-dependent dehydrogenase (short-subunit alcohol dehydrogenase family)
LKTSLKGKVALVAGATRGAGRGIAVELGVAGATVYCTGRSTREKRSEMNRPEAIEETAELVGQTGGTGIAVQVDHLVPEQVQNLVKRIRSEAGCLHILVNDIFGATKIEWNKTVWESDLEFGLHSMRLAVDTHAITSHFAVPLMIETPGGLVVEVNDGTADYNASHYRNSFFYDLAKASVLRMAFALGHELRPHSATAVCLSPGWLRSEAMLDAFQVTESTWLEATKIQPHFAISESPAFVGRPSSPWPMIRPCRAGMGCRFPVGSCRRSMVSPMSMAASPMRGATWLKFKIAACPPTWPAIAKEMIRLQVPKKSSVRVRTICTMGIAS